MQPIRPLFGFEIAGKMKLMRLAHNEMGFFLAHGAYFFRFAIGLRAFCLLVVLVDNGNGLGWADDRLLASEAGGNRINGSLAILGALADCFFDQRKGNQQERADDNQESTFFQQRVIFHRLFSEEFASSTG